MKEFPTIILIGVGFLSLALGFYEYMKEEDFRSAAMVAIAKITHMNDEHVVVTTEGRLNGPHEYVDHVCHYTVAFNVKDDIVVITAQLNSIWKICQNVGSTIPIVYDSRAPTNTVRGQNDDAIIHAGVLEALFGGIFLILSEVRRKSRPQREQKK